MSATDTFLRARDFLLREREDYDAAYRGFAWPQLDTFNWALDWFDAYARGNDRLGLWLRDDAGGDVKRTFAELSERSSRLAGFLASQGAKRGDRLLVMLPNVAPLWELMLASIKLGTVLIPTTTLLTERDVADRMARADVRHVVTDAAGAEKFADVHGATTRVLVGGRREGWIAYDDALSWTGTFVPEGETGANDPMLLYFTSGTTSKPKLVLHTHQSYPVGHLSTMYWIGHMEGDVHWNVSSPGWAKHAWSNFFSPWNAGATVFVYNYGRFDAKNALQAMVDAGVKSLCAPPTVWRLLFREDLAAYPVKLRELVGAGEPMNPEIIERVKKAWGITLRDGYGQTETTAQIGNTPGQPVRQGSMGRPLPGYRVTLLGPDGQVGVPEGEISLALDPAPLALMAGYMDDDERTSAVTQGGYYRTGDVASVDDDGYYWYVGRADDVFKSSDYRISPFELESLLIEHEAVQEAAVVPSPDPVRLSVPKAFITLSQGFEPDRDTALEVFRFIRKRMAPYLRVRRLQFDTLPKTISGKIRRVQLREGEHARGGGARGAGEFWEEDFPELKEGA
ncbi:MAG TPA: AMP-binding protein [Trueperaceae bacterium]|nr:AMP-binding protein [Trueperaceae bacterium]